MALTWDFNKDFIGIAYRKDRLPEFIYSGNAMMIFTAEYPDSEDKETFRYSLKNFYADKEHLKNCINGKIYNGSEYSLIILKPCKQAYEFIKIINGLWDVQITSKKDEFIQQTREQYRKVGYQK